MYKMYLVAMGARRAGVMSTKPGAVIRDSYEAAVGGANLFAVEEFPMSDGYSEHFAFIAEVPANFLDKVRPPVSLTQQESEPLPDEIKLLTMERNKYCSLYTNLKMENDRLQQQIIQLKAALQEATREDVI